MAGQVEPWPKATLAEGYGILCLGLPRTGSLSLTTALNILGYDRIHHGSIHVRDSAGWAEWGRAAWCAFPYMRNVLYPNRRPIWLPNPPTSFDRADWDDLIGGDWQGVTDFGALVAQQLVETYPGAKVILVERDVDKWAESANAILIRDIEVGSGWLVRVIIGPMMGYLSHAILWDCSRGWLRAKNGDEMRARLKDAYLEHYALVRRIVPEENLLNYRLGDGWEPLCEFLGRPVPNVPYPWVNDRALVLEARKKRRRMAMRKVAGAMGLVVGSVLVVWIAVARRNSLVALCSKIVASTHLDRFGF